MDLETVPVLYPTLQELQDPIEYLSSPQVTRLGIRYGMCKLVPPEQFHYMSNIDKNAVVFYPRLQQLSHLNVLNRARWFFIIQLSYFNENLTPEEQLYHKYKKPYIIVKGQDVSDAKNGRSLQVEIYLYDLFFEILKWINKKVNSNSRESMDQRDKFKTFHEFNNLLLLPLDKLSKNKKLWNHLSKQFQLEVTTLSNIFDKYLKHYYKFLYYYSHDHLLPTIDTNQEVSSVSLLDAFFSPDIKEEYNNIDEQGIPPSSSTVPCHICNDKTRDSLLYECKTCNNWFHGGCFKLKYHHLIKDINALNLKHCHECVVGNAIYGFTIDTQPYTISQFAKLYGNDNVITKQQHIVTLEKEFWDKVNNCMSNDMTRYGADIPYPMEAATKLVTSLSSKQPINLVNLPNDKRSLLRFCNKQPGKEISLNTEISGMTLPWLYVGSKFSTFCWHMEDQYTFSANYQHEGNPKVWYSVPPQSCYQFGAKLFETVPDLFIKDPNLLHQLTCLISPYDKSLRKSKINIFKTIQNPGEFIITFPQCFHSGFNTGYNFNEAVNFTTDFWLNFGIRANEDYKFTAKTCVFDIYWLLESILREFMVVSTSKLTNLPLYRDAFQMLLNQINIETKRLDNFTDIGVSVKTCIIPPTQEIICSQCHTLCTFAFCKDEDTEIILCLEHGLNQVTRTKKMTKWQAIVRQDMDYIVELLRQCSHKLDK